MALNLYQTCLNQKQPTAQGQLATTEETVAFTIIFQVQASSQTDVARNQKRGATGTQYHESHWGLLSKYVVLILLQ